jgi:hypothetical protein
MGSAKWVRFAVLAIFSGLFFWLSYIRGEPVWLAPAIVFFAFAVLVSRR